MHLKILITIIITIITSNAYSQDTESKNISENFFKQYIQLSDNFDPKVADLYTDKAKIHASRTYPLGFKRSMELTGIEYKKILLQSLPLAKQKNDISKFSSMKITKLDKGFKIKANRYSELKCYKDTGYYMVIKPNANGELKIVEEYSETKSGSDC